MYPEWDLDMTSSMESLRCWGVAELAVNAAWNLTLVFFSRTWLKLCEPGYWMQSILLIRIVGIPTGVPSNEEGREYSY